MACLHELKPCGYKRPGMYFFSQNESRQQLCDGGPSPSDYIDCVSLPAALRSISHTHAHLHKSTGSSLAEFPNTGRALGLDSNVGNQA